MAGQVVRLAGDALGYHLHEGRGWAEGYVVILNLAVIHKVFKTEEEALEFATSIPEGWEPEGVHAWTGDIPKNEV